MKVIDACGLSCPEPVLLLKQALSAANGDGIELLVDNRISVENCTRFAESQGFRVALSEQDGLFALALTKS